MSTQKKKALGRGLSAILESPDTDITSKDISGNYVAGAIAEIQISKIETNPFQPRTEFDETALQELADSITEQGIIQPLTIRKMGYDKYQLISGERRLRASILAGLETVPCYIRVANDEQMLEWALIENIQRENLNAIEVAISYQRLADECQLTQEELSQKVGKNRSTVTNYLRLLKLPAEIQAALRDESLSMGHARCLISITDEDKQLSIARKAIEESLSVRETEKLAQQQHESDKSPASVKKEKKEPKTDDRYISYVDSLKTRFNRNIQVSADKKGRGNIVIPFTSEEDLNIIMNIFAEK